MLRSLRRGRAALAALMIAVLSACGSMPDSPPDRVGFPVDTPPAPDSGQTETPQPADDALPDLIDPALFDPVRRALRSGDWMAASLALPRPLGSPTDTALAVEASESAPAAPDTTQLWVDYYAARIALLRGDLSNHASGFAALLGQPLPGGLHRELLLQQLREAELAADAPREVDLGLRLLRAGGHAERALPEIEAGLWSAVQRLSTEQARTLGQRADPELQGWLDLAASAAIPVPREAAAALMAWEARYPAHGAAERAAILRDAALSDSTTTQLSLLLPLTGPLASASEAVTGGFLAAFYADAGSSVSIDVVDTGRYASVQDAYTSASEGGASVIVGPLGKRQVESLLEQRTGSTPLLTLNRPESGISTSVGALMLSLAPEDEGRQLAEQAYAAGARRALVVRPEGSWGDRMESALRSRWTRLGAQIPATAVYGRPNTHSAALSAALGLDASAGRSAEVRALFDERIETSGRRRDDLDAVILLARSSEEARALKPLINYHYAGDLAVFALSTADTGSSAVSVNQDLSGLRLLAMPWRVGDGSVPGLAEGDSNSFTALHALGADAYALARRWWRMHSPASPVFRGLTARLEPGADGSLKRRLNMAEYRGGALRRR